MNNAHKFTHYLIVLAGIAMAVFANGVHPAVPISTIISGLLYGAFKAFLNSNSDTTGGKVDALTEANNKNAAGLYEHKQEIDLLKAELSKLVSDNAFNQRAQGLGLR